MTEELDHDDAFTEKQQLVLAIAPRVAGCISLISSTYMAVAAFRQRKRLYHRLMLGLTLHMVLYAILQILGTTAVPVGTPNVLGARGNTQTCTAQGFFTHVVMSGFFYYVFMSLYSFQAVRNNFKVEKYLWIEKWIHIGVHVFPVGSAFYLLSIDAFNHMGHYACYVASIPAGCGDGTEVVCDRGPQNIGTIASLFVGIPYVFILVFPTFVMIALYFEVRRKQSLIRLQAKVVGMQAGLYLLVLYWAFLFPFIHNGIKLFGHTQIFVSGLLSIVNISLSGFWMLLVYLYFRVSASPSKGRAKYARSSRRRGSDSLDDSADKVVLATTVLSIRDEDEAATHEDEQTISFNIFDGTNASGVYSEFIYGGDSDDETEDRRETTRWDHDIQKHI